MPHRPTFSIASGPGRSLRARGARETSRAHWHPWAASRVHASKLRQHCSHQAEKAELLPSLQLDPATETPTRRLIGTRENHGNIHDRAHRYYTADQQSGWAALREAQSTRDTDLDESDQYSQPRVVQRAKLRTLTRPEFRESGRAEQNDARHEKDGHQPSPLSRGSSLYAQSHSNLNLLAPFTWPAGVQGFGSASGHVPPGGQLPIHCSSE